MRRHSLHRLLMRSCPRRHSLHLLLSRVCSHICDPPHSLHLLLRRLWGQKRVREADPRHSLHRLLMWSRSHVPDPPHSLHLLFWRLWWKIACSALDLLRHATPLATSLTPSRANRMQPLKAPGLVASGPLPLPPATPLSDSSPLAPRPQSALARPTPTRSTRPPTSCAAVSASIDAGMTLSGIELTSSSRASSEAPSPLATRPALHTLRL